VDERAERANGTPATNNTASRRRAERRRAQRFGSARARGCAAKARTLGRRGRRYTAGPAGPLVLGPGNSPVADGSR